MRRHHDMGGVAAGPVDRAEHANDDWENRVDAMMVVLSGTTSPVFRIDERRRAIEDMAPAAYDRMGYYDRWLHALAHLLVEKGVLTGDEIAARVAAVKARPAEGG